MNTTNKVHLFYYLWYGNPETDGEYKHWNHEVLPHWEKRINDMYDNIGTRFVPPENLHSPYYPLSGPYSSKSRETINRHFQEIKRSGSNVIVVSWWGQATKSYSTDTQGVNTDNTLRILFEVADSLPNNEIKIAFHLEPYPSRSIESVSEDIRYLISNYGSSPSLYRDPDHQFRPVFYIYDSYHISPSSWSRLLTRDGDLSVRGTEREGVYYGLWLDSGHGWDLKHGGFDGIYTYFSSEGFSYGSTPSRWSSEICPFARSQGLLCSLSLGPGYNDQRIRPWNSHRTKDRGGTKGKSHAKTAESKARGGGEIEIGIRNEESEEAYNLHSYYSQLWIEALRAKPDTISVTSFNEWGEGTQIEPAKKIDGSSYHYYQIPPFSSPSALSCGSESNGEENVLLNECAQLEDDEDPYLYLDLTRKYTETFLRQ